jgi:hypothetical protein
MTPDTPRTEAPVQRVGALRFRAGERFAYWFAEFVRTHLINDGNKEGE